MKYWLWLISVHSISARIIQHIYFGPIDLCTFWPCGHPGAWKFVSVDGSSRGYFGIRTLWNWDITTGGIFQLCELSDMGKLKHRDVSAQRYFGSMKVLVQEH